MLKGKKILLGVTSGIAIYKVVDLVSKLKKEGADLSVIMTENACKLVTPLTFQTMARCKVHTEMFRERDNYNVEHISLTEECDAFLIAPATANTIAKVRAGIADNLLTTSILACQKPVIFATAMNTRMYENPITQDNIKFLSRLGYNFIEPNSGFLACNSFGKGRMSEPIEIVDYLDYILAEKTLAGKRILITAGPTIERIDPVRYISNDSSGKMGYAIARAARNLGALVTLISGPVNLEKIKGVETIDVESADDMYKAVFDRESENDVFIFSAAVADYRLEKSFDEKIKKSSDRLELSLVKNKDIAGDFGKIKGNRLSIGFAAETENLISFASEKLKNKNFDYVIANDVSMPGAGFNVDTNIVKIISKSEVKELELMSKKDLAYEILDLI